MSFFSDLFGKKSSSAQTAQPAESSQVNFLDLDKPDANEVFLDLDKNNDILDLGKNDFLNLDKSGVNLTDIRMSAGWLYAQGVHASDIDLDLFAVMMDVAGKVLWTIYYPQSKRSWGGLKLDKDDRVGSSIGVDNENIHINFKKIPANVAKIVFGVDIYSEHKFKHVRNANMRLVDQSVSPERALCRFDMSAEGGNHNAIIGVELVRTANGWVFHPIGYYTDGSIEHISNNINRVLQEAACR